MGRKTWSPPVFTGRMHEEIAADCLIPVEKADLTAQDELTGSDASLLICDDPLKIWTAESGRASILIDMKQVRQIAGVSHYPFPVLRHLLGGRPESRILAEFPSEYRISVSTDSETFTECAHGVFRVFGGEEIIGFEPCEARYVRLEILSTVGAASGLPAYREVPLSIGEITIYSPN